MPRQIKPGTEVPPTLLHSRAQRNKYTAEGGELMDPKPLQPPVGYKKQKTLREQIAEMVHSEHMRRAAESSGLETFEEADDFDVGDDYDPRSPYEDDFDPQELVDPTDPLASAVERGVSRALSIRDTEGTPPSDNQSREQNTNQPKVGGAEGGSKATPPSEPPSGKIHVNNYFRSKPKTAG